MSDDCQGSYGTGPSDARAVGDGLDRVEVNSDLPSAVVTGDSSSRPAAHSEMDHQAATALPVANASPSRPPSSVVVVVSDIPCLAGTVNSWGPDSCERRDGKAVGIYPTPARQGI